MGDSYLRVGAQAADAPLRGHGWMPDSFQQRSPRREWLDEITGDRPMYLFSADAHDCWFNTAAMRDAGIGGETPDPDPGVQFWNRDPDGTPTGHAVEGAATIPIVGGQDLFSRANVHAAQELTLRPTPSWGMTAGTFMSGGSLLLSPCRDHAPDDLGAMTFPADKIEAQIEAVQAAGFDMHIHVDGDGSARVVLDAYEKVIARHAVPVVLTMMDGRITHDVR